MLQNDNLFGKIPLEPSENSQKLKYSRVGPEYSIRMHFAALFSRKLTSTTRAEYIASLRSRAVVSDKRHEMKSTVADIKT